MAERIAFDVNGAATLRYWNIARQRHYRSSARCCWTLRVSVDRAARPSPHTRGKPRLLDVGRRILARDRFAPDSPLEGDGFELPVRGRGQSGCRPFWVGCALRSCAVRARRFWHSAVSATGLGDLSRRPWGGRPPIGPLVRSIGLDLK